MAETRRTRTHPEAVLANEHCTLTHDIRERLRLSEWRHGVKLACSQYITPLVGAETAVYRVAYDESRAGEFLIERSLIPFHSADWPERAVEPIHRPDSTDYHTDARQRTNARIK